MPGTSVNDHDVYIVGPDGKPINVKDMPQEDSGPDDEDDPNAEEFPF